MGREAKAQVQFRGAQGLVRVLLESDMLILRGDLRARIARSDLRGWRVTGDDLHIDSSDGPLVLTLGAVEAARWGKALERPVPTLADKLGLAGQHVWLITRTDDVALDAALTGVARAAGGDATLTLAVLRGAADLDAALAVLAAHPTLPIWAINAKGPKADLPESTIRTALHGAGMVDTKACAISPALAGTRYQPRKA